LGNIPDINIPEETIEKGQYEPDFVIKDAHLNPISIIIQLKNGDLCSAGDDGFINFWSVEFKFQKIIEIDAHKTRINDIVEFNNTLISCSNDRTIKVWVN
jgi:WD40 repeat protein